MRLETHDYNPLLERALQMPGSFPDVRVVRFAATDEPRHYVRGNAVLKLAKNLHETSAHHQCVLNVVNALGQEVGAFFANGSIPSHEPYAPQFEGLKKRDSWPACFQLTDWIVEAVRKADGWHVSWSVVVLVLEVPDGAVVPHR